MSQLETDVGRVLGLLEGHGARFDKIDARLELDRMERVTQNKRIDKGLALAENLAGQVEHITMRVEKLEPVAANAQRLKARATGAFWVLSMIGGGVAALFAYFKAPINKFLGGG